MFQHLKENLAADVIWEISNDSHVLLSILVEVGTQEITMYEVVTKHLKMHFQVVDGFGINLNQYGKQNMGIIGNFPYNISSQIFFQVLKHKDLVVEVVGMVQKEMAERMAAKEGSKTYGILSVLMQAWYDIDYLFTVHENVFNPPPKVKSAVIKMRRNATTDLGCDEKLFVTIVKQAFNQRRKTMRNSLRSLLSPEIIENEVFNKRPEQLSVKEFIDLTNLIGENSNFAQK